MPHLGLRMACAVSMGLLGCSLASSIETSEEVLGAYLAADDVCQADGEDEACSLSLRQLRGKQRSNLTTDEEAWLAGGPPYGHHNGAASYPKYDGFTLWLVEEFDQPIDLNHDPIWTWSDGGLWEGMVRFVKDNILFEDGKMKLIVTNNDEGNSIPSCSHAEKNHVDSKPHLSGEMRTRSNLFRYGRYEVRLKAPNVQPGNADVNGNYISSMFVFRDGKFKHWREIDFEIVGNTGNQVATNYFNGDNTAVWMPHIQRPEQHYIRGNTRSDFHTYAFEWLPDRITWYIDGEKVREEKPGSLPIPDMSGKIMMNLWIQSGAIGGHEIWNNRYPMHSEYDWFRFYRWNGDKTYPPHCMSHKCLPKEDLYLSANNPCDRTEGGCGRPCNVPGAAPSLLKLTAASAGGYW